MSSWPLARFALRSSSPSASIVAIREAIEKVAAKGRLTWDEVAPFADAGGRARVSKFQPCLPPEIELGLVAREVMDVDDASAALARSEPDARRPSRNG